MKEYKFVGLILVIFVLGMIAVNFCNHLVEKTINETIENAVLVTSDENGYVLNFYGEEYEYSFN